jgi:tetratricopeptide (TPR) repeat protein
MSEPSSQNPSVQHLVSRKKALFLAFTIFIPIGIILCLELALRWFNYGHDVSLFGHQEFYGKTYSVMNPDVKFRYFGTSQFTPSTSIHYFLAPKPEGIYRIFCLGGSTTVGYPYYFNASFPSLLAERLTALFPQKKIEVINLGMTATNSFTVLDIARELSPFQPDLIIDYDGHNEFYGVLGVASHQTVGSYRFITLAYLRLIHYRSFQLVRNVVHSITGLWSTSDDLVKRGTMMEILARDKYVPYGSSMYNDAYSIFRNNLLDLKEYCRSEHIPLLLGIQVSNLRDQAPFVSNNSPMLTQQQKEQFQSFYKNGIELQSNNHPDSALVVFRSALTIDSFYADVHYRLAQCLEAAGEKREALAEYILARDNDELRFRTDSKFNDLIRSMEDHTNCFVADNETVFKSASQDSLIGSNLITEHLHPFVRGAFLMAKSYAQTMRRNALFATQQEWSAADTLNENTLWQNRCVTELDDHMAEQSLKFITSGWPFKAQPPVLELLSPKDTVGQIAQQLAIGNLGWLEAHAQSINFYRNRQDWKNTEREYKAVLNVYPHIIDLYMELASIYFQQKRFDDMKALLLFSLQITPTLPAYYALGNITLDKGDPRTALKFFEKMDDFPQKPDEKLQYGFTLAYAYSKAGEFQKSKIRLNQLLTDQPNFKPALDLLEIVNKQLVAK